MRLSSFTWIVASALKFAVALLICPFLPMSSSRAEGIVTNCNEVGLLAAVKGGGIVTFGCNGSIVLSDTLVVSSDTVLDADGRNVTLTAGTNAIRILRVKPGVHFTARQITILGAKASTGAGLLNDGGTVELVNCTFDRNTAAGRPGADGKAGVELGEHGTDGSEGEPAFGGAIFNRGELFLTNCVFSANIAEGGQGAAGGRGANGDLFGGNGGRGGNGAKSAGGAIYNLGQLTALACSFINNVTTAGNGGAESQGGSGFFPGRGGNGGGGGSAFGGAIFSAGECVARRCLFSANRSEGGHSANAVEQNHGRRGGDAVGGALYIEDESSIINSTFTRNHADGGDGGHGASAGFAGDGGDGGDAIGGAVASLARITVRSCTFSTNSVAGGSAGAVGGGSENGVPGKNRGGNVARLKGSMSIKNSILAYVGPGGNCSGQLTDLGHNLSSDDSCGFHAPGSRNRIDPRLGPLGDHGGPTETIELLKKSPAIDAGSEDDCPSIDQRGVPRPQGRGCDIGACERSGRFSISGRITDGARGLGGISVAIEGQTATTDTNGVFTFPNLLPGTYTIAALSPNFPLSPRTQEVVVGPAAVDIDFVRTFGISGRITENGQGVPGLVVQAGEETTDSDANGFFLFSDLEAETYTVQVLDAGAGVTPLSRSVTVGPDSSGADFNANKTRLTSAAFGTNGIFGLTLFGIPGRTYSLESSTNLLNWNRVGSVTADPAGLARLSDTNTINASRGFYRVILP